MTPVAFKCVEFKLGTGTRLRRAAGSRDYQYSADMV